MNDLISKIEHKVLNPIIDLSHLSAKEQFDMITSRSAAGNSIISKEDLLERLGSSKKTGKPLRVKFGIDPTGSDIHIGHAVSLINLRIFQKMGHEILFIIGDFTATIGDPSGRTDDRPPLTRDDVAQNMSTYVAQAGKVIDLSSQGITKYYNSEWMDKLSIREWISTIKKVSVSSLLQRDDFRSRLSSNIGISLAEMEYALFMGYDSVVLNPDIEIAGIDQYLNLNFCRSMMYDAGQKPEIFITYDLLPGTSGEKDSNGRLAKMSKSKGNYVALNSSPEDMYGKTMSIPDDVMWIWYRELTELSPEDIFSLKSRVENGSIHPKDVKHLLARCIVGIFNDFNQDLVKKSEEHFKSRFGVSDNAIPSDIPEFDCAESDRMIDLIRSITGKSGSLVRSITAQGGLKYIDEDTKHFIFSEEDLHKDPKLFAGKSFRLGKRDFFKIKG